MISVTTRTKNAAVTFIELLVIVIIITILSVLSIPRFRIFFDNLELENFVKDIYYLSLYLQGSAIGDGKIYYLNINKDAGEFYATSQEAGELKGILGRFGKIYKTPQGITISLSPPEKTGIHFYPDATTDGIIARFHNRHKREISLIIKGVSGEIQIK